MVAMRMMQASAHDVIDVIAMGHRFVPAGRAMLVGAARLRRALHRVGSVDRNDVLVDMILVHVMEMPVMQIIDVAVMADRRMPTFGTMLVSMIGMMLLGASSHDVFTLRCLRCEWGPSVIAFRQHAPWCFPPNEERECRKANSRCALPRVVF